MYTTIESRLGIQPIANTSTVQNLPLGTRVRAYDPTYGEGEFVYLEGVASTVAGSSVTYNALAGTTALTVLTSKNLAQPVAVAMSANVASQFGWYQTVGVALIKKTAAKISPNTALWFTATGGSVSSTAVSGAQVVNCRGVPAATLASAATFVSAQINEPFYQGQTI